MGIAEESKDSTSESESDEESTVKFGSIKRRPPVKSSQKQEAEMRKSNIKTSESASRPINKKVSDSSDSDEDISLPEKRKIPPESKKNENHNKNDVKKQPVARFAGFFSGKKAESSADQKEEKKSMFGFFTKSETKKENKEPLQTRKIEEEIKRKKD